MKYLVTGAAGFIGRHTAKRLFEHPVGELCPVKKGQAKSAIFEL